MRQLRQRPVNLNLLSLQFPLPAIVSFAHRISGLLLIFLIPILLFALQESLDSELAFEQLKARFNHPFVQIGSWILLTALGYHLLAGIRHLLMDMQIGDSLSAGRFSAKLIVILGIVTAIAGGLWIWWK